MDNVEVLQLEDGVCQLFARESGWLGAAGINIGEFDILLGSTAIYDELTFLTNNRRHFERFDDLSTILI